MEVVRLAEVHGYNRPFFINDLCPFWGYVIRSLNEDQPSDPFVGEHLAGSVLGPERPESEIGSAFLTADSTTASSIRTLCRQPRFAPTRPRGSFAPPEKCSRD